MEAVHGILWTNSAEGRMVGPQPGWSALTGQSFADYQDYAGRTPPSGGSRALHCHVACRGGRQADLFWEHRLRRHDGAWRIFAILRRADSR